MSDQPLNLPPLAPEPGAPVSLTIDGQTVSAHSGDTILAAAKAAGIKIPHMCSVDGLEPFGGCRVCVVEIEGQERPVPSCATPVEAGLAVTTDSERVQRLRKTSLELMLSDHNAFCLPPCKYGCPTNVDIAGFIGLIVQGDFEESQRVLKKTLPLPAAVGRICPHPCESVCRREEVEEPISICFSHRYVGDVAIERGFHPEEPEPATGKRVAVIGAGPAGLANAYYLALKGHAVTIFESLPQPGGMLRYGIPEYRLPKQVLDDELKPFWEMGIELKCNTSLGPDFSLDDLTGSLGFDAVFLGIGAYESYKLGIEGEELEGVESVIDFLQEAFLGKEMNIKGQKVAVIGGGFSAMDGCRVSLRLGAQSVDLLYRRTQKEMPAHEIEVRDALEEGVEMNFLTAPVRVEGKDGKVTGIVCQKMELGEPDASGRRRPQPVEGSEYLVEVDRIIAAIGQRPKFTYFDADKQSECCYLEEDTGVKCSRWQTIEVNAKTYQTDRPGVFAGGDVVTGAATVVQAIGAGRRAAAAMDAYLNGVELADYEAKMPPLDKPPMIAIPAWRPEKADRQETPLLDAAHRRDNFKEVDLGFSIETVVAEGKRCLQCICEGVEVCKLRRYSIDAGLLQHEGNRFIGEQHIYGRDTTHDFIQRDPNRCIDCGRCVRVCKYRTGSGCYEFTGHGFDTIAATPFDVSLNDTDCVSCGRCAGACPTGALFSKERQLVDWQLDTARCIFCADCVEVCPVEALETTTAFELAAYEHDELQCHLYERAREDDGYCGGEGHGHQPGHDCSCGSKAKTIQMGEEQQ